MIERPKEYDQECGDVMFASEVDEYIAERDRIDAEKDARIKELDGCLQIVAESSQLCKDDPDYRLTENVCAIVRNALAKSKGEENK